MKQVCALEISDDTDYKIRTAAKSNATPVGLAGSTGFCLSKGGARSRDNDIAISEAGHAARKHRLARIGAAARIPPSRGPRQG